MSDLVEWNVFYERRLFKIQRTAGLQEHEISTLGLDLVTLVLSFHDVSAFAPSAIFLPSLLFSPFLSCFPSVSSFEPYDGGFGSPPPAAA